MMWIEILPGRYWSTWLSCHDGTSLGGSGVTFTGTLACGRRVARTHDGREWLQVRAVA
jgi:hypothetical protein